MQSYTRRQLKEDRFASFVSKEVQLAAENRRKIIIVVAILIAAIAIGLAGATYINARDEKASIALGSAMRTYNAPLRGPETAATPDMKSFASSKERAQAALKEFTQISNDYSSTRNGKYARYMAGVAAGEAGDNKLADQYLTEAASYRDKDLASLAKFALASLYVSTQRDADAIRLYKELIETDSTSVPKSTAELELAAFYETKQQPAEAARIYQKIQNDEQAANKPATGKKTGLPISAEPKSAVAELAANKLQQLKQADTKK